MPFTALKYISHFSPFKGLKESDNNLSSVRPIRLNPLSFKYAAGFDPGLGLIVSKKYGNAFQRNLFKRRCRSAYKTILMNSGVDIALIVRPKKQNINNKSIIKSFIAIKGGIAN